MTTPIVEIQGVTFSYGGPPALEGITLSVEAGEFLGIVGPNAGGKSTLLKLILGLLEPQAGRIRVLERSPREARRAIGYVSQYPTFSREFPITVEQMVLMGRLGTGRPLWRYRRADHAATDAALAEVEAGDLARRQIGTLSGGQLQRVLLARALVSHPRLLILDEPTASIDLRLENDIFDLLKSLNARMTILVVSHDIAFISSYVRRVACINLTLVCHETNAINGQLIHDLYGANVRRVAHVH